MAALLGHQTRLLGAWHQQVVPEEVEGEEEQMTMMMMRFGVVPA